MTWQVLEGDCRDVLRGLPERSVQTCVTSPPYFGLRDYGTGEWEGGGEACDHLGTARGSTASTLKTDGRLNPGQNDYERDVRTPYREVCGKCGAQRVDKQIGLEPTPDEFVAALVGVFREVRRVLRDDGTVWLNLGDSYNAYNGNSGPGSTLDGPGKPRNTERPKRSTGHGLQFKGLKPKDLLGVPWRVAFALQADGWYLRSDIIWSKPNPMPESVTDRPTKAHEYLFLLSKGPRYFYDADAIAVASENEGRRAGYASYSARAEAMGREPSGNEKPGMMAVNGATRNRRSVWTVATQPYAGAHFATFPPKLIEPCILAGSSPKACGECGAPWRRVVERTPMVVEPSERRNGWQGEQPDLARTQTGGTMTQAPSSRMVGWEPSCAHNDDTGRSTVLDPFAGAGTTGVVAGYLERDFIGIELNPEYATMARARITAEGRPGAQKSEPPKVHDDQLGLEFA